MSTPNQPQDPYSAEGRGSGDQSGGVPPYPGGTPADGGQGTPGGVPQYGSYTGGDQGQAGGYGQGGYGQPAYGGQGYGGSMEKNNLGVWSLVLGIVGFFVCSIFTSIPGIIVGSKAKQAVARGEANNGSLANAGYIVSWVVTALGVVGIIFFIVLVATGGFAAYLDTINNSTY
ncbi:DUF4190 domain-containing protein [Cellulomonas pakistanensis]|uniref:DUF4190 domain-containing protein n=1 Tax=Cellulomonas pakistanensis TaxID=992287 RepID=A0A919P9R0_9CELL|nr:DUF4190 domain-containing protein [Cellulomonas pakistanensis]GIG35585.1 hypothetical protein Cpa01nite_09660 [Cellulomonas pakistanensis]